jgi:hypothetical protein
MARNELQHRFVHGNFAKLPDWSPEADFFLGVPARQRELVKLAEVQVGLARETIKRLEHKSDETSAAIRAEVSALSDSLAAAISQGAEAVAQAVDLLGDRLSAELVEIRWELQQIQTLNTQILEVLKSPRGSEAAELIQQGVRNLVNDNCPAGCRAGGPGRRNPERPSALAFPRQRASSGHCSAAVR